MNVDHILSTFNQHQVEYLMIGGMHFLIRHAPLLTYDVDLWIEDSEANRAKAERALAALDAEWGTTDADWGPVAAKSVGWLDRQPIFCLNSPHGAIDIFRAVAGLTGWHSAAQYAISGTTAGGVPYRGLSDADMLQCQLALDPGQRKQDRIAILKQKLGIP
ncbi:MAG TPA: hypothetical protein VFV87_03555 [Pirellulaceae bacterium]|nr:hypothetical protein [Pirellulaceae bacterium]